MEHLLHDFLPQHPQILPKYADDMGTIYHNESPRNYGSKYGIAMAIKEKCLV